ncbi:Hypothetical predicted protein [Octopus vulgaris]|uniref:Uncharacterized protein n=1 Tax=Octopus vulgaris TaxID=6645 RepID=A0AA36B0R1_OCTVU|nr:Hypothetical predicted protein [Octopus vulgaris]
MYLAKQLERATQSPFDVSIFFPGTTWQQITCRFHSSPAAAAAAAAISILKLGQHRQNFIEVFCYQEKGYAQKLNY